MDKNNPAAWREYLLVLAVGFLQGCVFYASYRYSPAELPFLTAVLLPVPFYLAGRRDRRFWSGMATWAVSLVLIDLGLIGLHRSFDPDFRAFVPPFAALAGVLLLLPSFLAKMEEGTFCPSLGTFCAIVLRVLFAAALAIAAVALFWFVYQAVGSFFFPTSLFDFFEDMERILRNLSVLSWVFGAPAAYWASHRPWLPRSVQGKGAVLLLCVLFSVTATIVWGAWLTAEEEAWKDPARKREWVAGRPVYGGTLSDEERLRFAARIARSLAGGRSLRDSEAFFLMEDLDGDGRKDVLFYCEDGFHLLTNGENPQICRMIRETTGSADESAGYYAKAVAEGRYRTVASPWKMLRFPELYKDVFTVPLVEGRASGSDWDDRHREVVEAGVREWLTSMPVFGGDLTEGKRLNYLNPLVECFSPLTFDRNARSSFCLLEDFDGDGRKEALVYIGSKFFLMVEGRAFWVEWAFMDVPEIPFSTPGEYREEVAAGRYRLLPDLWKTLEVGERRFRVAPRDYDTIRREKRNARE